MSEEEMAASAKQMSVLSEHQYTIFQDPDVEKYDDTSWTDWVLERGYTREQTETRMHRFALDALFNWPHEISTYINFMSIRLLGGIPGYYLTNGPYGEVIVDPIAGGVAVIRESVADARAALTDPVEEDDTTGADAVSFETHTAACRTALDDMIRALADLAGRLDRYLPEDR